MRERDIEAKLTRGVRKLGGECLKWVSPGTVGVPDRIVIMPTGDVYFVELKTEHGKLSGPQDYWQFRLHDLNCKALTLYGDEMVTWFLNRIKKDAYAQEIREMIWNMVEEGSE